MEVFARRPPTALLGDLLVFSPAAGHSGRSKPSKFDIEEEYKSTFRTKSYQDLLKEVQKDLKSPTHATEEEDEEEGDDDDDDGGSLLPHVGLSGHFLGPEIEAPLHGLLRDYIDSGIKARDFCHLLLKSIDDARANARVVQKVLTLYKCPQRQSTTEQRRRMLLDLARVAQQLDNPLSQPGLVSSPATHGVYAPVIPRLRSLQRRVTRRAGFVGLCCKALGMPLAFCGAARSCERQRGWLARLGARLDAAARGAYALDREFDTVGRILARVNDEVEHGRGVASAFLQNTQGEYACREVVRRLQTEEGWLLEQLQELEEHAYLCLLTINRARNPLVQDLITCQQLDIELA